LRAIWGKGTKKMRRGGRLRPEIEENFFSRIKMRRSLEHRRLFDICMGVT
jgi:hypothetical protein